MPTYEYVCSSCANAWEAEQRMTEPALDTCPRCHEKTAKRQISGGAAFILKGGGWYSDLYSSTPAKKAGSPSTSGSSGEGTAPSPAPSTSSGTPGTSPGGSSGGASSSGTPSSGGSSGGGSSGSGSSGGGSSGGGSSGGGSSK